MPLMWVVVGTSIWVLFDAKAIGVKKGQLKGVCDMGPWGWFFACLFLWIIGFPAYLAKRGELKKINSAKEDKGGRNRIYCSKCGKENTDMSKYCFNCGKQLST